MAAATLVAATGLVQRYGRGAGAVTALNGVDFQIEVGEFVAVIGPSGSGKSSLMNLIGLLDAPTAGKIWFQDKDVAAISDDARARIRNQRIGFVFQSYHLLPRRSALGNVELPLLYAGVPRVERLRRAVEALERVGLADRTDALPSELSGGEQQRVAIARALVSNPDLLLADEPTGALDSRTSGSVLALLKSIQADGRTLILVTHDRDVASCATRIISIADGRIVGDGPSACAPTTVATP